MVLKISLPVKKFILVMLVIMKEKTSLKTNTRVSMIWMVTIHEWQEAGKKAPRRLSCSFYTGRTGGIRYVECFMQPILWQKLQIQHKYERMAFQFNDASNLLEMKYLYKEEKNES